MALGNQNYYSKPEDNNKKVYDPTVYAPIQFKNPKGFDPSELSFSYWNKLLKITISPKKEAAPGDAYDTYDRENNISIHINYMKARILYNEIEEFLKDPNKMNNTGVNSGASGFISISNGKEYGINSPVLVIRKMDDTGKVNASYAYQFNSNDYHTGIRNFDEKSLKYDEIAQPNIELIIFQDLLRSYYESASYATAYTVIDASKYDNSRLNTKLDLLLENAGLSTKKGKSGGAGGKSFFQRSADLDSSSVPAGRTTTLDDLASDLDDMD